MGVGEIIALVIVAILIVAIACIIFTGTSDKKRRASERLALKNATKPGSTFIFYGENGGGDPFKSNEHFLYVLDEKNGWIKIEERIFTPTKKTPLYTNVVSHKKTDFINWILLHRDVQFIENK
jgi:hypothetical protein